MRTPFFVAGLLFSACLLAACGRDDAESTTATDTDAETQASPPIPQAHTTIAPSPPVASGPSQPPAPIVEGMYVIYSCDDGTEPRVTYSGNLVKVELTADTAPMVLSARASASNMSDTYSDDTLTLHRDGMGITLDAGSGKTTRCTESEASA